MKEDMITLPVKDITIFPWRISIMLDSTLLHEVDAKKINTLVKNGWKFDSKSNELENADDMKVNEFFLKIHQPTEVEFDGQNLGGVYIEQDLKCTFMRDEEGRYTTVRCPY